MSAWMYVDAPSLRDFRTHAASMSSVSAAWITIRNEGRPERLPHPPGADQDLIRVARANHVPVFGLIQNDGAAGFNAATVERALGNEPSMQAHAAALVAIAAQDGLNGLDLDYESLRAADRSAFTRFVRVLAQACHARGLTLAIALHPKESEPGTWDGPQAQDFAAIGRAVDFARLMTYDEHWNASEAGPVSSPDWSGRVARFAASLIPRKKLDLGMPGYGYDWVGKHGTDITWAQFTSITETFGAPRRDSASSELTLSYRAPGGSGLGAVVHTVFFPDARADAAKLSLAQSLHVHGVALWRLGTEDPDLWNFVNGSVATPHP